LILAVVIFIIAWIACAVTTHLIRRANLVMGKLRRRVDEMTLTNLSIIDPRMKCTIDLGVSYDTDVDLARRLILEETD
jgi:hypothetical protein